jgi:hypothetical protein
MGREPGAIAHHTHAWHIRRQGRRWQPNPINHYPMSSYNNFYAFEPPGRTAEAGRALQGL